MQDHCPYCRLVKRILAQPAVFTQQERYEQFLADRFVAEQARQKEWFLQGRNALQVAILQKYGLA